MSPFNHTRPFNHINNHTQEKKKKEPLLTYTELRFLPRMDGRNNHEALYMMIHNLMIIRNTNSQS